jgi:hypothetical protein
MKAKCARFYGWSYNEIESMPFSLFLEYTKCIDLISSEETLKGYKVSIFPNLKKQAQEKVWKEEADKIKNGIDSRRNKNISLKDIAINLSRKMING